MKIVGSRKVTGSMETMNDEDDKGGGNSDHWFWSMFLAVGIMKTMKTMLTMETMQTTNDEGELI